MRISKARPKQLQIKETVESSLHTDVVAHSLAQSVLAILDHLCSEDKDLEELVNIAKPLVEGILRSYEK